MAFITRLFFSYGIAFLVGYIVGPMAGLHWIKHPFICIGIGTFFLVLSYIFGSKK